ncbi:unnamed protein product [Closterium sp. NIES-53]
MTLQHVTQSHFAVLRVHIQPGVTLILPTYRCNIQPAMALRCYLSLLLVLLAAFALTVAAADPTAPRFPQITPDGTTRGASVSTSRRALAESPAPKRVFEAYPDTSLATKMKDKATKMASDAVLDAIKVMKDPIKAAKDPEKQKALVRTAAKKAAKALANAMFPGHAGAVTAAFYVNQYVVPLLEAEIKKRLVKVKSE